jgi:hypothetical protein
MTTMEEYYDGLVGAWEGRLSLEITADRVPWLRRLVAWTFRVGPVMRTTLARDGAAWRHTTHVSWLGLRGFYSEETIAPAETGFVMAGTQWFSPGRGEPYSCPGAVSDDASGATYHLQWLGEPMTQRTRVVPDGLAITQETSWSRVSTTLRRRAA